MKTARFSSVVAASGTPSPHLAWIAPEKDPAFQNALKAGRVMTLQQELRGGKKDHGEVGFVDAPHARYLIFPKPLRKCEGMRVVGIDYDLFAKDPDPLPQSDKSEGSPEPAPRRSKTPTRRASQKHKSSARDTPPAGADEAEEPTSEPAEPRDEPPNAARPGRPKPSRSSRQKTSTVPNATKATGAKESASPAQAADNSRTIAEIERSLRDLKRGKTVAAYERLQQLAKRLGHSGQELESEPGTPRARSTLSR